jgi:uncharacterized membrane protein (DUF106 family)
MEWAKPFITTANMPFVVGIVAILMGGVAVIVGGVVKIAKMLIVHQERMAKIAHGIDPDYAPPPANSGQSRQY